MLSMSRPNDSNLQLHVVTSALFLTQLKALKSSRYARVQQNYLVCKARIRRLQQDLLEEHGQGNDVSNIERMIATLEQSMRAHGKQMNLLRDGE